LGFDSSSISGLTSLYTSETFKVRAISWEYFLPKYSGLELHCVLLLNLIIWHTYVQHTAWFSTTSVICFYSHPSLAGDEWLFDIFGHPIIELLCFSLPNSFLFCFFHLNTNAVWKYRSSVIGQLCRLLTVLSYTLAGDTLEKIASHKAGIFKVRKFNVTWWHRRTWWYIHQGSVFQWGLAVSFSPIS